jgi:energy-coupling factor transporter transmembrane protein EcfT
MVRQAAAIVLALGLGLLIVAFTVVSGMGLPLGGSWGLAANIAAVLLIAAIVYTGVAMSSEIIQIREFLKQLAVWLAITSLLPLVVWYGTAVVQPPPDDNAYDKQLRAIAEKEMDADDDIAKKEELRKQRDAIEAEQERQRGIFNRTVFWVAYPLGLVAFVVGSLITIQSVGSAVMFGGLSCLTTGCYSYWDKMDSSLRFGSLLIALAVVIVIGIWRFYPAPGRPLVSLKPLV